MWDAEEHLLLQSVLLEPPPGRRLGQPEFGRRSVVTTTPHHRSVLVLYGDVVTQLLVRRPSRQRPPPGPAAGRQVRPSPQLPKYSQFSKFKMSLIAFTWHSCYSVSLMSHLCLPD